MHNYLRGFLLSLAVGAGLLCAPTVDAQRIALKTNTLDWVTLQPNAIFEAQLSPRISLQLGVAGNPFKFDVAKWNWRNWRVEPEIRYWFNRPMACHFLALSATATGFNLHSSSTRLVGDAVGVGLSYGYALVLAKQWNVEFELGAGIATVKGRKYPLDGEWPANKNYSKIVPVPIRAAINFSYIFR